MTTKTKQLATLIRLASQKNALVPVTANELLDALKDIENELEIISLYADALAAKESLKQSLQQVTMLLFVLKNKAVHNFSGNKNLLTRTETLHTKIVNVL